MGTGRKYQKKPQTRPVKKTSERRRRVETQRRRLMAFGLPEEKVKKMNTKEVRDLLKRPAKLVAKA